MKPSTTIKVLCLTIFMFFVTTNLAMAQIHYDSSGNVGIGTTSPGRPLHIEASSNINIRLEEDGEGTEYFEIGIDNSGDLNIYRDNGYIAMSIEDSSGDVGIGTASPELELDVDGEVVADHYYYRSDVRLKKNITTIDNALDKVIALRGVKFEWRTEESSKNDFTVERKIGFIAQEVEEVLPEAIFTDSKGYKAVAYGDIISVLVEAVKAQQVQIEELRARIEALE